MKQINTTKFTKKQLMNIDQIHDDLVETLYEYFNAYSRKKKFMPLWDKATDLYYKLLDATKGAAYFTTLYCEIGQPVELLKVERPVMFADGQIDITNEFLQRCFDYVFTCLRLHRPDGGYCYADRFQAAALRRNAMLTLGEVLDVTNLLDQIEQLPEAA